MAYSTSALDLLTEEDRLTTLWSDNLSDKQIANHKKRRVEWLYRENPYGPSKTQMIVDSADGIIGCASSFPRGLSLGFDEPVAGILSDFSVDRKHRAAGAAVAAQRALAETAEANGFSLLYGYPNRASSPIFKRVGYQAIAEAVDYIKPLRAGAYLDRVLGPRLGKLPEPAATWAQAHALGPLSEVGGEVADFAVSVAERCVRHTLGAFCTFQDEARADASFDDLWDEARGQCAIEGPRTSRYLNWRYIDFPTTRFRIFTARERDGKKLRGYIAYSTQGSWVNVSDLVVRDLGADLDALLCAFSTEMRARGFRAICMAYVGTQRICATFKRHGFVGRPNQRFLMVRTTSLASDALSKLAKDPESWGLFDGELDI